MNSDEKNGISISITINRNYNVVIFAFTLEIICDNTLKGKPIKCYIKFWKIL